MAEDWFFFDGILEFNSKQSNFSWKQNDESKWIIRQVQSSGSHDEQIVFTDSIGHLIRTNLKTRNLLIRSFCSEDQDYLVNDHIDFNWKISNETKVLQNLECRRATTHFRGRDYEVWFTPDIPVPAGPWKFFGLPGLIVEVEDLKKEVIITLKELRQKRSKKIIDIPVNKKSISLKDFNTCLDNEWEKSTKKIRAEFAQLRAEFPDVTILVEERKSRPSTELNFE